MHRTRNVTGPRHWLWSNHTSQTSDIEMTEVAVHFVCGQMREFGATRKAPTQRVNAQPGQFNSLRIGVQCGAHDYAVYSGIALAESQPASMHVGRQAILIASS